MNTTAKEPSKARRRRRKHSAEFKAQAVAACRPAGVSIAAMAMANGVNANLLRRWILEADEPPNVDRLPAVTAAPVVPSFIPVPLAPPAPLQDIRIELHRSATVISITWPINACADFAVWIRELLR